MLKNNKITQKLIHPIYKLAQALFARFNSLFSRYIPMSPMVLRIRITNDCDLSCNYCYLKGSLNIKEVDHLSLEEWSKIISKLPRRTIVDIAGAEPFKARNFSQILNLLLDRKLKVSLITNGQSLDLDLLNLIVEKKLYYLMVSLDGPEKEHNHIRQSPEAFQKAVEFIRQVKKIKEASRSRYPTICIKTSLLEENIDNDKLQRLQDFIFDDLGVDQQTYNLLFQNSSRGGLELANSLSDLEIMAGNTHQYGEGKKVQVYQTLLSLLNHGESKGRTIQVKPPLKEKDVNGYIGNPASFGVKHCLKPFSITTMYYDGSISPCDLAIKTGNIRNLDFNFKRLWQSSSFQGFFKEFSSSGPFIRSCEGCNLSDQCKKKEEN